MFLPSPDLASTDACACFGVSAPAVRIAPAGAVLPSESPAPPSRWR